jgi:glycosyltransferase
VKHQDYSDVEHIIIDGASVDGTLDILEDLKHARLTVFSEKDHGIYDAMNKGILKVTGDIIAFLNADDWYASQDVLSKVATHFKRDLDYLYADLDFVDHDYRVRRTWKDQNHQASDVLRWGWQPAFPTMFFNRKIFNNRGFKFNQAFSISGDYDFLVRLHQMQTLNILYLPYLLVHMRLGGASTSGIRAVLKSNYQALIILKKVSVFFPPWVVALKIVRKFAQLFKRPQEKYASFYWRKDET